MVVGSGDGTVLLLERSEPFAFWQSVTGSLQPGESHADAARRELMEETGLSGEGDLYFSGVSRQFAIDPRWRDRFGPGIVENVEFEWHYRLRHPVDIKLSRTEHSDYRWVPAEGAIEMAWSWTNRDAIRSFAIQ